MLATSLVLRNLFDSKRVIFEAEQAERKKVLTPKQFEKHAGKIILSMRRMNPGIDRQLTQVISVNIKPKQFVANWLLFEHMANREPLFRSFGVWVWQDGLFRVSRWQLRGRASEAEPVLLWKWDFGIWRDRLSAIKIRTDKGLYPAYVEPDAHRIPLPF